LLNERRGIFSPNEVKKISWTRLLSPTVFTVIYLKENSHAFRFSFEDSVFCDVRDNDPSIDLEQGV